MEILPAHGLCQLRLDQSHTLSTVMVTKAPCQRQLFGTISLEEAPWQPPGMLKHTTHARKKMMVSSLHAEVKILECTKIT